MHFTFGVMSLHRPSLTDPNAPVRTLEEAKQVLAELKPKIAAMLNGERLRVSLDAMDIMWPRWGNQEKAHVMWVGPSATEPTTERFMAVGSTLNATLVHWHAVADAFVAEMIQKAFKDAGLLVDGDRQLKVGCDLLSYPVLHQADSLCVIHSCTARSSTPSTASRVRGSVCLSRTPLSSHPTR